MFGIWGLVGGILLFLFGIFAIFFYPSSSFHQERELAAGGIFLGFVAVLIAAALIFW